MDSENFSLASFNKKNFFDLVQISPQSLSLFDHLKKLEAKKFVVEKSYVDRDYLLDYTQYFSRSFDAPKRFTKRVHFFSEDFEDNELVRKYLQSPTRDFIKKLEEEYLGFFVRKPLDSTPIGRTLVIPPEGNGKFPALLPHTVHLFGQELQVRSLPYQQQDEAVVKCASTAIWSTLNKLSSIFDIGANLSPAEVRSNAKETFKGYGKLYPASGLNILQIIDFFKRMGLEVAYQDCDGQPPSMILGNLYSYLRLGVPILAHVSLGGGKSSSSHLVTLVGYELDQDSPEFNKADQICALYAHDDAIGPFSKVELNPSKPRRLNCSWNRSDDYSDAYCEEVTLRGLIAPIYHKIRIPFVPIYRHITNLKAFKEQKKLFEDFSIYLTTLVKYKEEVSKFESPEKMNILTENNPRFLWIARAENGSEARDYLFDATHHCSPKTVYSSFIGSNAYFKR
ncbi:hypothetical protein KGY77_08290 [Candidatus Bipolaricaulota bacterium]|nr:hypothetical protein [Candidatus Bipolaricaulota bacterium]